MMCFPDSQQHQASRRCRTSEALAPTAPMGCPTDGKIFFSTLLVAIFAIRCYNYPSVSHLNNNTTGSTTS